MAVEENESLTSRYEQLRKDKTVSANLGTGKTFHTTLFACYIVNEQTKLYVI